MNEVRRIGILLDVEISRTLRHYRERLKRDVRLQQPWQVHVSTTAVTQQVPIPEKAVRVKIGDEELLVQVLSTRRNAVGWPGESVILSVLDHPRRYVHGSCGN